MMHPIIGNDLNFKGNYFEMPARMTLVRWEKIIETG